MDREYATNKYSIKDTANPQVMERIADSSASSSGSRTLHRDMYTHTHAHTHTHLRHTYASTRLYL